ncbi:MAG: sigma-54 dependent transcriptional regulator, partial [bacterium]|nr:sigma-54 dependent transcriptional regulator [bacterium]
MKPHEPKELIYESGELEAVVTLIQRAAPSRATVLLLGESGTGKERIAKLLHDSSPRCDAPFVSVNCAAIPETLLESELFGHERGAFTGADSSRVGLFERANGGTLFIDEIGDLPLNAQVKLLRFLQDQRIQRVGGRTEIQLDVRIVAATHRDLPDYIKSGKFREDLFYRINVITVKIPPLRHRRRDIRPLVNYYFKYYAKQNSKTIRGLNATAWQRLMRHDWPGNVRELENAIEHAVVVSESELIDETDLPVSLTPDNSSQKSSEPEPVAESETQSIRNQNAGSESTRKNESIEIQRDESEALPSDLLRESIHFPLKKGELFGLVEAFEKSIIEQALQLANHNRSEAARLLGISEKNIR